MKKYSFIFFFLTLIFTIAAQPTPYVVLISFDGFRWDYSERGITPNIENMKEDGVTAKTLKPCFPSKTFPNHISIITGMYTENHGIVSNNMQNLTTGDSFSLGNRKAVKNPLWYKGTAFWEVTNKYGIKSASYFWPSSSVTDAKRRPTYFKYYDHEFPYSSRVDSVIHWLSLPYDLRPHFITAYFHDTDSYGHNFGPNSAELDSSIKRLDNILGEFYEALNRIGMRDSVNVILVSDHGMTEVSDKRVVDIEPFLRGFDYQLIGDGPFITIEPEKSQKDDLYRELKKHQIHFNTYTKETIPEYYHYSRNELIYSIILIAENGWSLVHGIEERKWYDNSKGNHGYDNNLLDMHGTFVAAGPLFKAGYKTGTLLNIDIYPLLCEIFDLEIEHKIDGQLPRIKHILKEN